jgi:hypothetical protein
MVQHADMFALPFVFAVSLCVMPYGRHSHVI